MNVPPIQAFNSAAKVERTQKTAKVRARAVDPDEKRKKPSPQQSQIQSRDKKLASQPTEAICTGAVHAALFKLQLGD
jgi:hypothetical protein